jgi:hypothetical protein
MADVPLYPGHTNVPHEKRIAFKFFPDAGNAPTVPTAPHNLHIASIEYVSTGVFRITLSHAYKNHVVTYAQVNGAITGVARFAQGGPVANVGTSTAATVDIVIVDGSGNPANMVAADDDSFVSGEIVFCDTAGV